MKKSLFVFLLSAVCALSTFAQIQSIWPLPEGLSKYDKNNDNLLSGEEITEKLSRLDLNQDSIVTPSEALFVLAKENFEKERPDYKAPIFELPDSIRRENHEFKNTILISMDGFDRAVIKELLDANKLLALRKIARANSDADAIVNVSLSGHKTETKTGHAVMLTSLIPEHSLVQSNRYFQPIPKGYTIFERIKNHDAQIKTIFVSSKRENVGAMTAEDLGNREEFGIKILGGPYLNAKETIDVFSDSDKTPQQAKERFLKAMEISKDSQFFAFLHFRSPDKEGHGFGRESKEYRDIAIETDSYIAEILEFLKANNLDKHTRIIITADHGFNPDSSHHNFAPWITMITNDSALLTSKTPNLFDIPATIMASFGIDLESLNPKAFGKNIAEF